MKRFAVSLFAVLLLSATASAQCAGGSCSVAYGLMDPPPPTTTYYSARYTYSYTSAGYQSACSARGSRFMRAPVRRGLRGLFCRSARGSCW